MGRSQTHHLGQETYLDESHSHFSRTGFRRVVQCLVTLDLQAGTQLDELP